MRQVRSLTVLVVLVVACVFGVRALNSDSSKKASTSHSKGQATGRGAATSSTTALPQLEATFSGPDGVEAQWVVDENNKAGTTNWQISGDQTADGMQAYADQVQVTQGQSVKLYVSTQASSFHVEAYRMGYYQGKGARLVWQSAETPGTVQPTCPVEPDTNMVQCSWTESLSFPVTAQWPEGEYLLKLVGSGGQQSYAPLTVWNPASHATYVIMDGVFTAQVFNSYGGYDFYQGATPCAAGVYPCSSRSRVVSFDRPYAFDEANGSGSYLSLVYPLTRFAEQHGLDIAYWTDFTLDAHGPLLSNHKVLISTGHDEEWSLAMRNAVLTASQHGINQIYFGASAILRKVRLAASPIGPDREIVNYRDTSADPLYGVDNADVSQNQWNEAPALWDPGSLLGGDYIGYNNNNPAPMVDTDPTSWLYAGTSLAAGSSIPNVLFNDFQQYETGVGEPTNVEILSHSPVVSDPPSDHHYADTTYYTTPSGAGIFQSATTQWIPAMQSCLPSVADCPGPTLQQLTGNLFRVFGEGPAGQKYPSKPNWQQYY